MHAWFVGQTLSHEPQLAGSVAGLTHRSSQHASSGPHPTSRVEHAYVDVGGARHVADWHESPAGHTKPHAPQL